MNTLVLSSVSDENKDVKVCLPKSLKKFKEEQGNKTEKNLQCSFTVPDLDGDKGTSSWRKLDQLLKNDKNLKKFPRV